jgi:sterol desaturase/sphingolipid hydroxylase (fatty acid hydroxylase superfamily)
MDDVLRRAPDIHAVGYFGVLIVLLIVEAIVPRRHGGDALATRWFGNVMIAALDVAITRAMFPIAALALSILCLERGWGLFNVVPLQTWFVRLSTVLLLDLAVYAQHYTLHRVGFLWRLHRAHHTDPEFDVTTGLRFHPLESVLATGVTLVVILAVGAPPVAVLIWQVLSGALNFVEHMNVRLPSRFDRLLRLLLVTPDMHRIHHSAAPGESRMNLANMFSFWDRLFGTYLVEPTGGHDSIVFGLADFADPKHLRVHWILAQPFLPDRADGARASSADDTTATDRAYDFAATARK